MRILAVGAHPDDIEICCAGTLLRYAEQGHEIIMAIATNGEQGHMVIMPDELARIRRSEAEASAKIADAKLIWLNYHDQFMYHTHETRMVFIEMIRQANPHVIITHNPEDYSQDHRVVSELVFTASFVATVPHIETASKPIEQLPVLYYMDHVTGTNFQPQELVDITSVMDKKTAMLRCHRSQLDWLKEHDNIDVVEMMQTMARFRALSTTARYCEGFRKLDAWGRNLTSRILP